MKRAENWTFLEGKVDEETRPQLRHWLEIEGQIMFVEVDLMRTEKSMEEWDRLTHGIIPNFLGELKKGHESK